MSDHTSKTTDQTGERDHLDLEELADILAAENSADVAAHAATCTECHDRLEALGAALGPVATSLSGMGQPEQPPELGARLHRAILREQAVMHPGAGLAAGVPSLARQREKRRTASVLGPLLAGAAALALVGVVIVRSGGGDPTTDATATGPERTQAQQQVTSSGTNYDRAGSRLRVQLPALLSGTLVAEPAAQGTPDGLSRLRGTPALASCIASLTETDDTQLPLALDYAKFEGQPALVVVAPASRATKLDVYFVGPTCSMGDAALLHFARLDRPAG